MPNIRERVPYIKLCFAVTTTGVAAQDGGGKISLHCEIRRKKKRTIWKSTGKKKRAVRSAWQEWRLVYITLCKNKKEHDGEKKKNERPK